MSTPLAYTIRDCASALRVSERTVHRLIKSGALSAVRIGRAVRIPADALAQFLERGTRRDVPGPAREAAEARDV